MMSAKGHVMYYSNASNTGEVPTADCISMNSKKGEVVGGSREDISVARPESGKKKERKEEKTQDVSKKKGQIRRGVLIPRTCIILLKYTHYIALVIMTLCPEVLPCQRLFTDAGCDPGAFLSCFFPPYTTRRACRGICMYYALFPSSDGC